jgi:type II secretory ATPase GspE/PulE/Tfp pilus assembly ATPase PilB-like protein
MMIKDKARETCGMKTLWEDGIDKVLKKITTIEEVSRVTAQK